jgi:micrococcal nuclease
MKSKTARIARTTLSALAVAALLILFSLFVPLVSIGAESDSGARSQSVWASHTGAKYHRQDCSTLRGASFRLDLQEALQRGLEPCKVCEPPQLESGQGIFRVNEAGLSRSSAAPLGSLTRADVFYVIDGDTVKVKIHGLRSPLLKEVETVRLLGVDTPETSKSPRPQGYYGQEAAEYARSRLEGKPALLAFDWDLRDAYGRLLAYLYLEDGECFNRTLLSQGYAWAYLRFPFAFSLEFEAAGKEAEKSRLGLWGTAGQSAAGQSAPGAKSP